MQKHTVQTIWTYKGSVPQGELDLAGFEVEALDGTIGKIDEASRDADDAHFIVDTGFWIFGKRRLIPAGVVASIDSEQRVVRVNMTKEQIHDAPDWDDRWSDEEWHAHHDRYYAPFGW